MEHGIAALLLYHPCRPSLLFHTHSPITKEVPPHRIPQTLTPTSLLAGVDLFLGLQRLDTPLGRGRGRETTLVFTLLGGDDGRMRLRVRGPIEGTRHWSRYLRQQIEGCAPGTTVRLVKDDLQNAVAAARPGQVLIWSDLVLLCDAAYPLNDLAQFSADPLGPLS